MYDPNRTVYFDGQPYKIVHSIDRNIDPAEKIEGVKLLGSIVTIKHCETDELLRVYPWDLWDPNGLDGELMQYDQKNLGE